LSAPQNRLVATTAMKPTVRLLRPLTAFVVALTLVVGGCSTAPAVHERPDSTAASLPAEALNPDVRPETIHQTICVPGYAASVRPSTSYTNGVKRKLLRDRGLPESDSKHYELDHIVPLALGGHPRHLTNLMLQKWEGEDGAKKKDLLERRLQRLVCTGKVPLREAQQAIFIDWNAALIRYGR